MSASVVPVKLTTRWAPAAASVHRRSFEARLPWLAGLHTAEEDAWFYQTHVFPECTVWGVVTGSELLGFIAFRDQWVDQLYVVPEQQGRGIGRALLDVAQSAFPELQLWTFQKNLEARKFYENRGFTAVEFTDGSGNEEQEPDVRYIWRRIAI